MPPSGGTDRPRLLAISDLHVRHRENRRLVERIRPRTPGDWLIVAGDVAERLDDARWALETLASRFERVIWAPGNHELWSMAGEPAIGVARYDQLVAMCRRLGVLTPEDPYPLWHGAGGPARIAALFLLYDYSFRPPGAGTKQQALAAAYEAGVVCTDELLLRPDPYPDVNSWCAHRVAATRARLDELRGGPPLVLVNHYPLVREPTRALRHAPFALWCGTDRTAAWHREYDVAAMVYGHLHLPGTLWIDGVPFVEVSMGYPREWSRRTTPPRPTEILLRREVDRAG